MGAGPDGTLLWSLPPAQAWPLLLLCAWPGHLSRQRENKWGKERGEDRGEEEVESHECHGGRGLSRPLGQTGFGRTSPLAHWHHYVQCKFTFPQIMSPVS